LFPYRGDQMEKWWSDVVINGDHPVEGR